MGGAEELGGQQFLVGDMPERHRGATEPGGIRVARDPGRAEQRHQPEPAQAGTATLEHREAKLVDQLDQSERGHAAQERQPEEIHHPGQQLRFCDLRDVPPQQVIEITQAARTSKAAARTVCLGRGSPTRRCQITRQSGHYPATTSGTMCNPTFGDLMIPSTGASANFVIEETAEGRNLVVTGDWSAVAVNALLGGSADGLTLNYARGYRERSLDFLQEAWPVRRLHILARTIKDLTPVYRLARTLESLIVDTSPGAVLDLRELPHLTRLAADWEQVRETIGSARGLRRLFVAQYGEPDLRSLGEHRSLAVLDMKEDPQLESLVGIDQLPALSELEIFGAGRLLHISDLAGAAPHLRTLHLKSCRRIGRLDAIGSGVGLEFLNVSDCGDVQSLSPLAALRELRVLLLYGTTRILDGDLTPLTRLPHLAELRMQSRREYRPSVREVQGHLVARQMA